MNLRAKRALGAGTLVTDFNTSSFSIVQSFVKEFKYCSTVIVVHTHSESAAGIEPWVGLLSQLSYST